MYHWSLARLRDSAGCSSLPGRFPLCKGTLPRRGRVNATVRSHGSLPDSCQLQSDRVAAVLRERDSCDVTRGRQAEKDHRLRQISRVAQGFHGNVVHDELLLSWGIEGAARRVVHTGRDAIHGDAMGREFDGQRFCERDDASLGCCVGALAEHASARGGRQRCQVIMRAGSPRASIRGTTA